MLFCLELCLNTDPHWVLQTQGAYRALIAKQRCVHAHTRTHIQTQRHTARLSGIIRIILKHRRRSLTPSYLQSHSCGRGGSRGGRASRWGQCLRPSAVLGGAPVSLGQGGGGGGGRSMAEGVVGVPASAAPMLLCANASSAQGCRARHSALIG